MIGKLTGTLAERNPPQVVVDCNGVGYEVDGVVHDEMPMTQSEFHHATPVYELFDGWKSDISGARSFDDLPKNAQVYVRALEELSGAPFWAIGVGPSREQTIILR